MRFGAADLSRLAAGLLLGLRTVEHSGKSHHAMASFSDVPMCDQVSTALTAAAFALPELREERGALVDALVQSALSLPSRGALLGKADAGINVVSDNPSDFDIRTPFFALRGDLSRGDVVQTLRVSDEVALAHTGNLVEFKKAGRTVCLDAEDTISDFGISRDGHQLLLWHETPIAGEVGLFRKTVQRVGTLRIEYLVSSGSAVIGVSSTLRASHRLRNVRVTTALDRLDQKGFPPEVGHLQENGRWRLKRAPDEVGVASWGGDLRGLQLVLMGAEQGETRPILYLRSMNQLRVHSITAEARAPGRVRWLLLRYGGERVPAGGTLTAREERLLVPRGPWADIAEGFAGSRETLTPGLGSHPLAIFGICDALRLARLRPGLLGQDTHSHALEWLRRELNLAAKSPVTALSLATGNLLALTLADAGYEVGSWNTGQASDRLCQEIIGSSSRWQEVSPVNIEYAIILFALVKSSAQSGAAGETLDFALKALPGSALDRNMDNLSADEALALALFARAARMLMAEAAKLPSGVLASRQNAVLTFASSVNALRQTLLSRSDAVVAGFSGAGHTAVLASMLSALLDSQEFISGI